MTHSQQLPNVPGVYAINNSEWTLLYYYTLVIIFFIHPLRVVLFILRFSIASFSSAPSRLKWFRCCGLQHCFLNLYLFPRNSFFVGPTAIQFQCGVKVKHKIGIKREGGGGEKKQMINNSWVRWNTGGTSESWERARGNFKLQKLVYGMVWSTCRRWNGETRNTSRAALWHARWWHVRN